MAWTINNGIIMLMGCYAFTKENLIYLKTVTCVNYFLKSWFVLNANANDKKWNKYFQSSGPYCHEQPMSNTSCVISFVTWSDIYIFINKLLTAKSMWPLTSWHTTAAIRPPALSPDTPNLLPEDPPEIEGQTVISNYSTVYGLITWHIKLVINVI